MKKFVKMSLVAALAVAGTTASAQPLAEAIQNVDVSGTVVYRYDDRGNDLNNGTNDGVNNNYKVGVSLSSKVNDDVKFGSRFIVGGATSSFVGLDTGTTADANVGVSLSTANFTYSGIANTTVTVGKQGLATPWTNAIDSDGSEETGTGILAATTMGPVTIAGGYFNQTNLNLGGTPSTAALDAAVANANVVADPTAANSDTTGTTTAAAEVAAETAAYNSAVATANAINAADLLVAGAMAKVGPVNVQAWYLEVVDVLDSYFVSADTSFDIDAVKIGLAVQHSELDNDGAVANDDNSLTKYSVTATMAPFNAGITYSETGKDGSGIVNAVSKNSAIGYTADLAGTDNSSLIQYDLGMQVTPELHVGLNYDEVSDDDAGATDDFQETYVQITYNMSKNLSAYVRLADGEDGSGAAAVDYNRGRLQVEYKF